MTDNVNVMLTTWNYLNLTVSCGGLICYIFPGPFMRSRLRCVGQKSTAVADVLHSSNTAGCFPAVDTLKPLHKVSVNPEINKMEETLSVSQPVIGVLINVDVTPAN